MIDYDSPIPLYYQIKEELMEEIRQGTYAVGDTIPSEHQLASQYNVSRNTAQRAIEDLVHKGVLTRKQGLGTFVAAPRIEQCLTGFYSFSRAMQAQGIPTSVKVLSMRKEPATAAQARYLEIGENEELYVLSRIRYADGSPIMLETSRIPVKLAPELDAISFETNSLYAVLEKKYSIVVTRAKEIFEPVTIRKMEAEYLNAAENSPAIMLDRIAYDASGRPIEFCRSIVPGDKCRFYTELR